MTKKTVAAQEEKFDYYRLKNLQTGQVSYERASIYSMGFDTTKVSQTAITRSEYEMAQNYFLLMSKLEDYKKLLANLEYDNLDSARMNAGTDSQDWYGGQASAFRDAIDELENILRSINHE